MNEKIRLNLEKQQKELREAAERLEMGEFELRKKPLDGSPSGEGAAGTGQMPVPRSLMLSQNLSPFQASASNTTPRPQLYDDDDNSNSKPAASDTNSNLDAANTSAASQPSEDGTAKSNGDDNQDPDSQQT